MTSWDQVDWETLKRIRQCFLNGNDSLQCDYWRSRSDLVSYYATFAQRIGWKWDAVIQESKSRGLNDWTHKPVLLDWGCGSGIASRRMLRAYGPDAFASIQLYDRSTTAALFATDKIREEFGNTLRISNTDSPTGSFVLTVSHVLSELAPSAKRELFRLAEKADASFFVEPGRPNESALLIELREALREKFVIVAPCPHQSSCGMRDEQRKNDWCHNFAIPPSEIFQDPNWVQFSKLMKIDLRSLPVSFLVLVKKSLATPIKSDQVRIIGRPRTNKIGANFLGCGSDGVVLHTIQKRTARLQVKQLKEEAFSTLLAREELP